MSQRTTEPSRLGVVGLYLLLLLLVFWPILDWFTTVGSPQFGNVDWRYGAFGLLSAYLATPLLGLGIGMAMAFILRHGQVLRAVSMFCLILAILLIPAMGSFALDVIQLRSSRPPESLPSFHAGALIAEGKHFTYFLVLLLLGLGGWKTAEGLKKEARSAKGKGRSGDLVGAPRS